MTRSVKIICSAAAIVVGCFATGFFFIAYLVVNYFQGVDLARQGYRAAALRQHKLAITKFDAALKKPLGSFQRSYALVNRGASYSREGRLEESIRDNTEALRLNPDFASAYEGRAWAYHEKGDAEKTLADLTECIRRDPNSFFAHYTRGRILYDRKEFDRALADFEEAVRCDPNAVDGFIMR